MRRFITKSLEYLIYVAMLIIIVGAAAAGANTGGAVGMIGGLIAGVIFSVVTFGVIFVLMDTADNTRRMVQLLEQR